MRESGVVAQSRQFRPIGGKQRNLRQNRQSFRRRGADAGNTFGRIARRQRIDQPGQRQLILAADDRISQPAGEEMHLIQDGIESVKADVGAGIELACGFRDPAAEPHRRVHRHGDRNHLRRQKLVVLQ